jgi:hypothetical protein
VQPCFALPDGEQILAVGLEEIEVCVECMGLDKSRFLSDEGFKHLNSLLVKRGRNQVSRDDVGLFFESRSGVVLPWYNPLTGRVDPIVMRYIEQIHNEKEYKKRSERL